MKLFTICLLLGSVFVLSQAIIGGSTAYAGQFRYTAAITVQTSDARLFCGGTLLNNNWIITAGQCVNGAVLLTINLGSNSLIENDSNRLTLATSDYVIYSDFNPVTLENDVGLIKLRLSISFTDYVKPVDFLGSHEVTATSILLATGWGQISDTESGLSDDLQWVQVTALSNVECKLTYGNQVTGNTICVAGRFNEGSCYGDTGSPLLQELGRGYVSHAGIASFVSGNGCESTDPSGYVRVYSYLTWIQNVTRS